MQKQWYIIKTFVGFEHRVEKILRRKIQASGNNELFGEIIVPTEKVVDLVRGKRETVEERLFPGYLFAQIVVNEKTWDLIHSVPKVLGFLSEGGKPLVIPEEEIRRVIEQVESGMRAPRPKALFFVGEKVRVVDGPFREFTGTIETVNANRARLRVALRVFGRPTPVDLDFIQVEAA